MISARFLMPRDEWKKAGRNLRSLRNLIPTLIICQSRSTGGVTTIARLILGERLKILVGMPRNTMLSRNTMHSRGCTRNGFGSWVRALSFSVFRTVQGTSGRRSRSLDTREHVARRRENWSAGSRATKITRLVFWRRSIQRWAIKIELFIG